MDPDAVTVETLRREMNQRFDAADRRFDATDRRLDAMDQRFDAMDQRFDAMDQRFDAMDQRFDAMDRRLEDTGTGLRALIESVQTEVRLILEHLAPAMTQVADHERR